MRIALVTHKVDLQDGQGRVNYEIARAALEEGHEVTVVAEFCSDEIARHPRGTFVCMRNHPLPTQLARNLYFAVKGGRWLRRHRKEFDVIQANGFVTWEPADIVAVHYVHTAWLRHAYFPFRWSSFSPYAWYQRALAILNARFEMQAFSSASRLVAVSRATADALIGLGVPAAKITVIYNGVNTEDFCPGLAERGAFGLPEGVPLGLFVGELRTERKNLDTVLRAMQRLPALHLAVAGKVEGSTYPQLALELGVAERVHFLGQTSRIASLMRSCDFFVFPSRYEAHPLVLMEAMATGLPVVASRNFGAADYAEEAGLLIDDPNDVAALGAAMQTLLERPEARSAYGATGRRVALSMQWSDTAAGYLRLYADVVKERSH
jgi:glycosyltransferase involved in cell wall biosynthesis